MIVRLKAWAWLLAICLTQAVFNTGGAGLWWVVTGRGVAPDPDEPLSARIGRNAIAGKRWALWAEAALDAVLGAGHCRNSHR
ncbi:hypothetical protein I5E68_07020 [Novosphingobium sp. YJ-S2-02]|uniref:Uncharacterized protein n=1 Tax=Novosphingobium aureum TaxID=2792964 RepID=A0A931HC30_9SPHN|nr:hypothetical protein [Novosphingobium aureum]MBH0112701.1 hypothetical protein [Novosphingobium aureum]